MLSSPPSIHSIVSTHSRPKAAADIKKLLIDKDKGFQHTAARRRLQTKMTTCAMYWMFQHTAARRRLRYYCQHDFRLLGVSTHSRPKAAACTKFQQTQRKLMFQHTAARRRLPGGNNHNPGNDLFQHTAARRRLPQCMACQCRQGKVSTHSRPKAAAACFCSV